MDALITRWNELGERDRIVLGLGGIGVLIILLYTFFWEPWHSSLDRLSAQVPAKRLAWQRISSQAEIAANYTGTGGESTQAERKPLLTVVEDTARRARLRDVIRQMTPGEEEGQVRVWLSDAPFDTWLTWVDTLGREHGVEVITATVQRSDENKVDIRATLGY
jgi:type II secretory pathway component PulM